MFGLVALPPPPLVDTCGHCDHQEANAPGFLGLPDDKPKPTRTLLIAALFGTVVVGAAVMFLAVSASHAVPL